MSTESIEDIMVAIIPFIRAAQKAAKMYEAAKQVDTRAISGLCGLPGTMAADFGASYLSPRDWLDLAEASAGFIAKFDEAEERQRNKHE